MRIEFIEIKNFRKLDSVRVEFGQTETVFVGANNSGKTSAMLALIKFLDRGRSDENIKFILHDFTITKRIEINDIGDLWLDSENEGRLHAEKWSDLLPCLDLWLAVENNELQYVVEFIPTLEWSGGRLGIRMILEPNLEQLYKDYRDAYNSAVSIKRASNVELWPNSLCDFLFGKTSSNLMSYFNIHVYILDESKLSSLHPETQKPMLQETPQNIESLDRNTLDKLFQVDIIHAQRGLSDIDSQSTDVSQQLKDYYDNHLDLEELPDIADIQALEEIQNARRIFNDKINAQFNEPLKELSEMGYPGLSDPRIVLKTYMNTRDGIAHNSSLEHSVFEDEIHTLPEAFNGLGYQNLIKMTFQMMAFRDKWMRTGKMEKRYENSAKPIPKLHLVLIEEPEAHLHAQVQQVFIKKAYKTLRNHERLKDNTNFNTQLIISTHSSYVVMGSDFQNLRYFRRIPVLLSNSIPTTSVVNMSNIFGKGDSTTRFVTRYLRATHCDLFFADAMILIEGTAERMLLPYFIKSKYNVLDSSYISICDIGGSHAHTIRPLVETLGIPCLIITDIDSCTATSPRRAQRPTIRADLITGNDTLKKWIPQIDDFDKLMALNTSRKIYENSFGELVRVAYQTPISINTSKGTEDIIPYTFEDALVCTNIGYFKSAKALRGIKKMRKAVTNFSDTEELSIRLYDIIKGVPDASGKRGSPLEKAEFVLDLLYQEPLHQLEVPQYIHEGLVWLQNIIIKNRNTMTPRKSRVKTVVLAPEEYSNDTSCETEGELCKQKSCE